MNSSFSTDNVLLVLTAASFVATAIFLLLSVLSRISLRLKTGVLRVGFSLGLAVVLAGVLARTGESTVARAPVVAAGGVANPSTAFTLSR